MSLVVLVALAGGVALGSIAAARRTASSYPTFLAGTNPSDLIIEPVGGTTGNSPGYSQALTDAVRRLPHVSHVESYVALNASLLSLSGSVTNSLGSSVVMVGSVDGLLFNQDRFTITTGRMADPTRPDEVVVTQTAAQSLGLHLGQVPRVGLQEASGSGDRRLALHIVGIGELNREIVQDQIARFPTYIVATPALTRSVLGDAAFTYYGVQLRGGARYIPQVERRFTATEHYFTDFQVASLVEAQAEQSIRPEALALGAFGAIAALAALLLALQAIARQSGAHDEDLQVMRAMGSSPALIISDGLVGTLGSIVLGAIGAGVVALAISPLAPIGPARPVYPKLGVDADWTVLGAGAAGLIVVLCVSAWLISFYRAPHRSRLRTSIDRSSAAARLAGQSGLPPSAVAGIRFAVDRGPGRNAVPTRWALLGAVLAMVVVVATFTFGNSLHALVSQPRLYGWNWDYAVQSSDGYGPVPNQATTTLAHYRAVAAWSGVWFADLFLDGTEVPVLLAYPGAPVAPPVVAGHGLRAPNQVVLGASTLSELHKRIGDTLEMQFAAGSGGGPQTEPVRLVIVGVATMPAIGISEDLHTSMGTGAIVAADNGPLTEALGPQAYGSGCNGYNMVFVRLAARVGTAEGERAAQHFTAAANDALSTASPDSNCGGNVASLLSVQRPAQIVNYRTMGFTPLLLAAGLALGAIVALGLALAASVKARRHDLALMKTLGFTQRQLAAAVAWQATIAAVVGVGVGVPLGIVLGRWLWILFAGEIGAVPSSAVPVWSVVIASAAALVLANLVAALPGRSAARTPAALVLRDE